MNEVDRLADRLEGKYSKAAGIFRGIGRQLYESGDLPDSLNNFGVEDKTHLVARHPFFEYDFDRNLLVVNGQEKTLSKTQANLLLILCANPNRFLTRDAINKYAWGSSLYGGMRSIDVTFSNLKELLGESPGKIILDSRYYFGYRLIAPDGPVLFQGDKETETVHRLGETFREHPLFVFSEDSGEVIVGEQREKLQFRAAKLLEYLLVHPNRMVSRDELIHNVWGMDFLGETRTVDVHITIIRRAIARLGLESREILTTVWGGGYMLVDESKRRWVGVDSVDETSEN